MKKGRKPLKKGEAKKTVPVQVKAKHYKIAKKDFQTQADIKYNK